MNLTIRKFMMVYIKRFLPDMKAFFTIRTRMRRMEGSKKQPGFCPAERKQEMNLFLCFDVFL